MLADASLRQGLLDESIKHAERALELGHGQAVIIQPLLAQALRLHGDNERAIQVLQAYLLDNVADGAAAKQLENFKVPFESASEPSAGTASALSLEPVVATSTLLASNWLPADIDEKVPAVGPRAACDLEDGLEKYGERLQELVASLGQLTANNGGI